MSLQDVKPADDGALVVGSTTAVESIVLLDKSEGISVPAILKLGGLNVVVAVNKNVLLGGVIAVSGNDNGRKLKVLSVLLNTKLLELNFSGTKVSQFLDKPVSHLWVIFHVSGEIVMAKRHKKWIKQSLQ